MVCSTHAHAPVHKAHSVTRCLKQDDKHEAKPRAHDQLRLVQDVQQVRESSIEVRH
eukprot:COSAG03_NODE_26379_length_259_cov_1.018750_1_plen_55_part_10